MTGRLTNWAGNVTFSASEVHRPASVDDVRELVAGSTRIRALGTGHSFNRIADTTGDLVTLADLPPLIEVDEARRAVTVSGGLRYGEVAEALHARGWALANLGSLPHISVGGACATGTHGSGDRLRCLAAGVRALELVTAGGDVLALERGVDVSFPGAVVALGALGVVTALTLDIEPAFEVAQLVYDDLSLDALRDHADEVFAAAYSVSVFTDWGRPWRSQVWRKHRVPDATGSPVAAEPEWLGARLAEGPRHPVPGMSAVHCTAQAGEPGPWHHRLPHFRLEFTPSSGEELQSEWLLPRGHLVAGLDAVAEVRDRVAGVLQVAEVRTVASDDLWLSPAGGRDSVALHFTWVADETAVLPVVALLDDLLAPLQARPHWGKISTAGPERLAALYPRWGDFQRLRRDLDPHGTFRNDFLDRCLPLS